MDPGDLDHRVMWAHSYEVLPPSPGAHLSTILSRPPRPSLGLSIPLSDVIDIDEGCCSTNALQEHELALYQMMLNQGVINTSDPMRIEPSTSLGEANETCPPIPQEIDQDWLVCQPPLLLTIQSMWMLQLPNMLKVERSNHNLKIPGWVLRWLLWMITHKKYLSYWTEIQEGNKDIPEMGTLPVLAIKQESQSLVMPAQAAVQNHQEVSVVVQRSLEVSVYGSIITDENQHSYNSPCPTTAPVSSSNPPQILDTPNRDMSNDRLNGEGARPKDLVYLDLYIPDGKNSRLNQASPKCTVILSHASNLLFIVRLCNLMEKYITPFLEWIGLPVISMPWRLPTWHSYQKGQLLCPRWVLL